MGYSSLSFLDGVDQACSQRSRTSHGRGPKGRFGTDSCYRPRDVFNFRPITSQKKYWPKKFMGLQFFFVLEGTTGGPKFFRTNFWALVWTLFGRFAYNCLLTTKLDANFDFSPRSKDFDCFPIFSSDFHEILFRKIDMASSSKDGESESPKLVSLAKIVEGEYRKS